MKLFANKQLTLLVALFINYSTNAQTVICPTETNLGTFDCNTISDVPPQVNSLQDAMEIYGIEITGALPETGATTIDSDIIFYCEENAREVTREVIIYNNPNFNFEGEEVATCVFTITTLANVEPPTFTAPPDATLSCVLGTGVEVTGEPIADLSNCSNIDITFTDSPPTIGGCPGESIFIRTWIATNACGNESEPQNQVITRLPVAPEFTVPADIIVPCGTAPLNVSITGDVTDGYVECEEVEVLTQGLIVEDLIQENTPCPGATTYTKRWGAVNGCGDATVKDQVIIVDCSENGCATEIPTIVTCPAETNLGTFDCNTIDNIPPQINSLEDAFEVYGIEIALPLLQTRVTTIDSDIIFYCESNAREVIREVIIYNDNFNLLYDEGEEIAICTFVIEIEPDLTAPVFSVPPDTTITCEYATDLSINHGFTPRIMSTDDCPDLNQDLVNFSEFVVPGKCGGILIRSWVATDACGNASESQTQTLIVEDVTGPEFTVPTDIMVACGTDLLDETFTGAVTDAYDDCEGIAIEANASIVNELTQFNFPCAGLTTYTKRWIATDGCGNATIKDQLILMECPADCSNQDICAGDILSDPLPDDCKCQVIETQILGCTDPADVNYNEAANCDDGSCSTNNPVVVCPSDTNLGTFDCNTLNDKPNPINTIEEAMAAPYNIEITSASPKTLVATQDSDIIFYCESNAREVIRSIIIYNDVNNNFSYDVGEAIETCTFSINTEPDLSAPQFYAPPDMEVTCAPSDPGPFYGTFNPSDDNCPDLIQDNVNFSDAPPAIGKCPGERIIVRSWTATDPCGNANEPQTQTIIIKDETGPEFTVPADITVACITDPMDTSVTGNVSDGFDECENTEVAVIGTIIEQLTQENTPCPGTTTYTKRWVAVDGCGNTTTKDQIIIVECPPDCTNQDICVGDIVTDPLPGECECQIVEYQVLGCLDPTCVNFDPAVNCDDGNCFKEFDLALTKELITQGPFIVGADTDITFTITVYNQGDRFAQNIAIIDYIPEGLILNDANWTQEGANATTIITSQLAATSASVDITFKIDPAIASGTYTNYAEIFMAEDNLGNQWDDIDSTPDTSNENDFYEYQNGNEDDHDGATFTLINDAPCKENNAGYFCE